MLDFSSILLQQTSSVLGRALLDNIGTALKGHSTQTQKAPEPE